MFPFPSGMPHLAQAENDLAIREPLDLPPLGLRHRPPGRLGTNEDIHQRTGNIENTEHDGHPGAADTEVPSQVSAALDARGVEELLELTSPLQDPDGGDLLSLLSLMRREGTGLSTGDHLGHEAAVRPLGGS